MNNNRRKDLDKVVEYLNAVEAPLQDALSDLEGVRDDESEAFENVPESMQDGDRGQAMQEALAALEDAISDVEGMLAYLEEAKSQIEQAQA